MRYIDKFYYYLNRLFSFLPDDTQFFKLMRIPALLCLLLICAVCIMQWCSLIEAQKDPKNFRKEKTRTYNSIHGLPENKKY